MNLIKTLEKEQMDKLNKNIPAFQPGDTLRVMCRIVEEKGSRLQAFEGVCIARSNDGLNSSFTVRKISFGEGVERVFPLHSPNVDSITVLRRGKVRRSKLYYLRQLFGKKARIQEDKARNQATAKAEEAAE